MNFLDFEEDKVKAEEWGNEIEINQHMTPEEIRTIKKYTGSGYLGINEYLIKTAGKLINRNETPPEGIADKEIAKMNQMVEIMDRAFERTSLPTSIVTYRRVSENQFGLEYKSLTTHNNTEEASTGDEGAFNQEVLQKIINEFENKNAIQHNFISTSVVKDANKSFTGERYAILLSIKVPQGTRALYVDNLSNHYGQMELLIDRGYTFQYEKFTTIKQNGKLTLKVDVKLKNTES